MAGENPGSINSFAAESGRDAHDPVVFAEFTHALGQWREEILAVDDTIGLYMNRHLAGSASGRITPLLPLERGWQPTTPADAAAVLKLPLLTEQMLGAPPEEQHSCDR